MRVCLRFFTVAWLSVGLVASANDKGADKESAEDASLKTARGLLSISPRPARAGDPNLPFLVTQLCNWDTAYVKDYVHDFATVREAQRRVTETVPGTALAVTIDLADKPGEGGHGNDGMGPKSIHPIRKREVGERNALASPWPGPTANSCPPRR